MGRARRARRRPIDESPFGALGADVDFDQGAPTFPFGAHIAVVEVDLDTGEVRARAPRRRRRLRHGAQPAARRGPAARRHRAGIGQALYEEVRYDADGNPLTSNLADYGIPSAAELPSFEAHSTETPTPLNPLGAKGIGEAATIGSTPAVQNAVIDALAHLGVRHIDMPCTPERVWAAIAGRPATASPTRGASRRPIFATLPEGHRRADARGSLGRRRRRI